GGGGGWEAVRGGGRVGGGVWRWADRRRAGRRSRVFEKVRVMYLRLLSRGAVAFLACGTPTVEHLAKLGIARAKVFNFPYWVDLPTEWSPPPGVCEENSASKPLRLLAIGRLVPAKAFDVAIKAVALANKNANRRLAHLSIVGERHER